MPYKIVQTIEGGETCLSVVPSRWEQEGVLFWPKKNLVAKLSLEEDSIPTNKWEKINCIKKREFKTRAEAYEELEKMEMKTDTEMDDEDSRRHRPKKPLRAANYRDNVKMDFNKMAEIQNQSVSQRQSIQATDAEEDNFLHSTEQVADNPFSEYSELITETFNENVDQSQIVCGDAATVMSILNTTDVSNIIANQQKILENQEKIMQSQAKLLTYSEYVLKFFHERPVELQQETRPEDYFSPVNTLEELEDLEASLKQKDVSQKYIRGMSFICGVTGKANGIDCCYKLIDYFITRQFLMQCSWTGNAKLPGGNNADSSNSTGKVGLKFFRNFRSLFLNLIMLADKDFSEIECDNFFKRIIRNSKQRVVAKTATSKHRNRPKNLKYKDKNVMSTNNDEIEASTSTAQRVDRSCGD
uniref:DUF4806 domain-containing protein n=1 Tax=Anopheles minimus TaxID=112268 RepID=A0A182VVL9_9DIPT